MTTTVQTALSVNTAGLAAGTYTATVTISLESGARASVPVTVRVLAATPTTPPPPPPPMNTTATLTWNAVTSSNLAGYRLYMGATSGVYGTPIDVGKVTSYVVNNLTPGNTFYFVVTSYNGSGVESTPSNEVSKSIY
jgi:hypothetical protein